MLRLLDTLMSSSTLRSLSTFRFLSTLRLIDTLRSSSMLRSLSTLRFLSTLWSFYRFSIFWCFEVSCCKSISSKQSEIQIAKLSTEIVYKWLEHLRLAIEPWISSNSSHFNETLTSFSATNSRLSLKENHVLMSPQISY